MRTLLIKAHFDELPPSTQRELAHIARRVGQVDQLVDVCWLGGGQTVLLQATFECGEAARHFLSSPLLDDLARLPHCRDVYIEDLNVIDGLTSLSLHAMQPAASTAKPIPLGTEAAATLADG